MREAFRGPIGGYVYRADNDPQFEGCRWKPSIHMPKWAARIWLEVTGVRVERVQDISEEDAIAEGIPRGAVQYCGHAIRLFRDLWDSINAKRGYPWEVNPWVWVVEFKRTETMT